MRNLTVLWKRASTFARAFFVLALAFLLIGVGTLGSTQSTGGAYELPDKGEIVYKLSAQEGQTSIKNIYLNVGTIYDLETTRVTLSVEYKHDTAGWLVGGFGNFVLENLTDKTATTVKNASFNWIAPFDIGNTVYELATRDTYRVRSVSGTVLLNEVVFVADDGTVIPAQIDGDLSNNIKVEGAKATIDSQGVPSVVSSSYFAYSPEEARIMTTIAEMRMGSSYTDGNVYHLENTYGALGIDLLAFGTLVFGMSPFGLRIFPMLAAFGVLVLGYLLCKKLFASDKAGFLFALIFALCGASFSLGHFGTPLMIGVFLWVLSVYLVHKFYAGGMKSATLKGALPLAGSGFALAGAICTQTLFVIPAIGTVALFVLGMLRQRQARAFKLSKAEGEEAIAAVKAEFRFKDRAAIALFASSLVVGAFLIAILAFLPCYLTYVKVFDNPALPVLGFFALLWNSISGSFGAANVTSITQSPWHYLYRTFSGNGDIYGVTVATFGGISTLMAVAGVIFAIVRLILVLVRKEKGKDARRAVRANAIPLAAVLLAVISAVFAPQKLVFLVIAYAFAFMLAGGAFTAMKKDGVLTKIIYYAGIALLGVQFALLVPFVFSIPLPQAVQAFLFA